MSKIWLLSITLFLATQGFAQLLPKISYRDYGYTKQVKKVTQIYYSIEYGKDGSVKDVEKVEQIIRQFNADGNIESYENKNFLDNSWAKSICTYKNGRLHQEEWKHSNPYLNRNYTYGYNKSGKIITEKIRFKDGAISQINFVYKDSLLQKIISDIDGTQSETERFYSQKGNSYKEIHRQKVPNEAYIVTNYFYLEGKEIVSYVEPKSYFYANAYLKNKYGDSIGEIKFKLEDDSDAQDKLYKGIQRFDMEAPNDNLPFDLKAYSEQTLQAYKKHPQKIKPYQMALYLHDDHKNIVAEAEVDLKAKKIAGIGYFKIEYADGTSTGTTEFLSKKIHLFEALLKQTDLF